MRDDILFDALRSVYFVIYNLIIRCPKNNECFASEKALKFTLR